MNCSFKALLMGATACFALTACGSDKEEAAKTEVVSASKSDSKKSPLDTSFAMKNAEPIDIDALMQLVGDQFTYSSAEFDEEIGAVVITDVAPSSGPVDGMNIGRVEIFGLNMDFMNAIDEETSIGDGRVEVFRKIRAYDVSADLTEGQEITKANIAALEFNALSVMQEGEEGSYTVDRDEIQFGGMAMKDADVEVIMGEAGDKIAFTAPDFRVMQYKDGEFGGFYARDLGYQIDQSTEAIDAALGTIGPGGMIFEQAPFLKDMLFPSNQSGSIAELSWDGLTLTNLIPYLESGEQPPISETDLISVGGFEMKDQKVMIGDKVASTTARIVMDPIEFYHMMPQKVRLKSEGMTSDMTAFLDEESADIAELLTANGFDNVQSESSFAYDFNPRTGAMEMAMDGSADGLYTMTFDMALSDFDYDTMMSGEDNALAQEAIMAAAIEGLTLKIEDQKVLDTLFAIAGSVSGNDAAELRQQATALLTLGGMGGAQISPRIPGYAAAAGQFVSEGGTLTISISPDTAVTFGAVAMASAGENPGTILDTLNLTVTRD